MREYLRWVRDEQGVDLVARRPRVADEAWRTKAVYGPPRGALVVAFVGARPAGAVGLTEVAPGVAELRRMYVRPGSARPRRRDRAPAAGHRGRPPSWLRDPAAAGRPGLRGAPALSPRRLPRGAAVVGGRRARDGRHGALAGVGRAGLRRAGRLSGPSGDQPREGLAGRLVGGHELDEAEVRVARRRRLQVVEHEAPDAAGARPSSSRAARPGPRGAATSRGTARWPPPAPRRARRSPGRRCGGRARRGSARAWCGPSPGAAPCRARRS